MSSSTIQPELVSLRAKLAAEIAKDEREAELITKRVQKNRELLHAVNASLGTMLTQATGYRSMSDTIRAAVGAIKVDRFTALDVDLALTQHFPTVQIDKDSVRTVLWTMQKKGEIICTRKGTNSQPAEYSRATNGGGTASEVHRVVRRRRRTLADVNGEHSK